MKRSFGLVITAILALALALPGTGFCEAGKKVAVFPFTMNSPQDLGFLQNGLFSMLSSRLADPGKVEVLDRETVDKALAKAQSSDVTKGALTEDKARMVGAAMGVDFVLFGSLTHFGESVSLDARMVDVAGQTQTLSFFEQSNAMGDVIPLVNSFAGDINEKVFNRRIENKLYARPEAAQEEMAPGGLQAAGGPGMYGGGMMATQAMGQGFLTHLKLDDVIRAMATGDIDKDGKLEIVAATDYSLLIYTLDGSMLTLKKKLDYKDYLRIVSIDIADINGNGYPEMFVSALTIHQDMVASFVVEYDGNTYLTLEQDIAKYFRVVDTPEKTKILLSQDKGEDPFSGRIYTMSPANNTYQEEKGIRMPRGTSVLSLVRGPVREEAGDEYLNLNRHERLLAITSGGTMEWESTDKFGGTNNVWLMQRNDPDASYRDRVYFNPRIKLFPVGEDQKVKAFVVRNTEIGDGALGRYKKFKDGHIQIMAWNGIAMAPVFVTMPVQGWISDFDIADIDGDGKAELLVSVVGRSKIKLLSSDKSSNIISYKLN